MDLNPEELTHGNIETGAVHLCVHMQRMFAEDTPWKTPWMEVRPLIVKIARKYAARTVFTRFIPAVSPGKGEGARRHYWQRCSEMTLDSLEPGLVALLPELEALCPPAQVFDKRSYSPWNDGMLHADLQGRGCGTLIVTGGETDGCVLATVLGAVDLGYRGIVITDALCSSSDETHVAVMAVYYRRNLQRSRDHACRSRELVRWKNHEQKANVAADITNSIVRNTGAEAKYIYVIFDDVRSSGWESCLADPSLRAREASGYVVHFAVPTQCPQSARSSLSPEQGERYNLAHFGRSQVVVRGRRMA